MQPKKLVIDACVAGSASLGDSAQAVKSVGVLMAIKASSHEAVFSQYLSVEWDTHESAFSKRWRKEMISKKRAHFETVACSTKLRNRITKLASADSRLAILKDMHLIEAALIADKTILSWDLKMLRPLAVVSHEVEALHGVMWCHLGDDFDAVQWLIKGAKQKKPLLLASIGTRFLAEQESLRRATKLKLPKRKQTR